MAYRPGYSHQNQQYASAPPSHGYGQQPYGYPPPQQHLPPGCPPGVDPSIFYWFQAVDQDRSGQISAAELRTALMNNKMKQFNHETCRLMIGMFDKDRDGKIDIHEFSGLWNYIQQWRQCFDSFDTDRSGNIDASELSKAFSSFGYRLSMNFCNEVVRRFDRTSVNTIDFDDFIQVCVMLKTLTDKFRQKDRNQNGHIQLGYEEVHSYSLLAVIMSDATEWCPLAKVYDPIQCGNIDGTGRDIHDGGILRALGSTYRPNKAVTGNSDCTLFVGKLNPKTSEQTLRKCFMQFGKILKLRVIRDVVTGYSKRYAFVEFSTVEETKRACAKAHGIIVDGVSILVEYEFERSMPGWIPRRLGGGFGGRKESGQLRFGCRLRPFKKPYVHSFHEHQKQPISSSSSAEEIRLKRNTGPHRSRDSSEYSHRRKQDSHHGGSKRRDYRS